jgi:hypothetical protein
MPIDKYIYNNNQSLNVQNTCCKSMILLPDSISAILNLWTIADHLVYFNKNLCVASERVIVVECQVGKFTAIIWPDQVSFWWMDFIVFTHWKNSQSIDRHVALIENLIPSLSQPGTTKQSPVESGGLILVYMFVYNPIGTINTNFVKTH